MSMQQGIDLSRFKKIASDGKVSTLRHSQGHEIKIAHSGLTDRMREQLKGMPIHLAEEGDVGAPMEDEINTPEAPAEAPPPAPESVAPPVAQAIQPPMDAPARPQLVNAPELKAEMVNYGQDLDNGHIHPETYHDLFEKKGTLGKIGTIFGLLVGGAGAGLSHQPNALMEMMNKEIANDLEAQKASATNRQNFAKLNLEHQMNVAQISRLQKEGVLSEAQAKGVSTDAKIKAYTLARAQMNTSALHHLVQMTNKLPVGSPQRAEAEKQLAFVSQGVQNENFNLADRAATAGALANVAFGQGTGDEKDFQARQNTLRMSGNAPIAKSNEDKHLPGVEGSASMDLTPDDRGKILAGTHFQSQLQRFIDWTKGHSGELNPKERVEGQALAAQVMSSYQHANLGGVYKPGEQDFLQKSIDPNPTKFFNNIRVVPKLEAVQQESASQLDDILKSKGFKGYEGSAKKEEAPKEQYKIVNGVKYKRGPNGEAIKVK